MMIDKLIYILSVLVVILGIVGACPVTSEADVMGTSVSVIEPELDIKNAKVEEVGRGGNLDTRINLQNIADSQRSIDRINLNVTRLDGSLVLSESLGVDERVMSEENVVLNYEFPGGIDSGEYVGFIEIYSKDQLLGQSRTIINIPELSPEVLGAATEKKTFSPVVVIGVSGIILICGLLLLLRNYTILQRKLPLSVFDVVAIVTSTFAFGLGVFGSFLLGNIIFTADATFNTYDPKIKIITLVFALFSVSGVVVLLKKRNLTENKYSIRFIHLIFLLTALGALTIGFVGGYESASIFFSNT